MSLKEKGGRRDGERGRESREGERGGRGEAFTNYREREREGINSLFTWVIDKHVSFSYIQPSPKQGTILDLIIHTHFLS